MDVPRGEEATDGVPPADVLESRTRTIEPDQLLSALEIDEPPVVYWESPDGLRLVGVGSAHTIDAVDEMDNPQRATDTWERIRYDGPHIARPRMVGGRSFDVTDGTNSAWDGFDDGFFALPRHLFIHTDEQAWHTVTAPTAEVATAHDEISLTDSMDVEPSLSIESTQPCPGKDQWTAAVDDLRDRIEAGAFRKVVIAHSLRVELGRTPRPIECVRRLRTTNPGCFISLIRPNPDRMFVAATPERLVERTGADIRSGALAGTMGRGNTNSDDERLSDSLRTDAKEGHEHRLVVDAIRSDLETSGASVTVEDRRIRRLRSVQHLFTPVAAHHPGEPHVLDLVDLLHPTPAVGGLPRDAARAAIRDIETFDRGWYAGPVGWFDGNGDGSFAIGIRSGIFNNDRGRLFAGAGIVEASDPSAEWEEIQWKYRPVLDALTDT